LVISEPVTRTPVGKKAVHHMDFEALVEVNRVVVALTGEPHSYSEPDRKKLEGLLEEVETRADNEEFSEAVPAKAALLVFKLASGQHFKAGNKRTAMVAGLAFFTKNGYKIDITDPDFVSIVDKAGIGAAGLSDIYSVMEKLRSKTKAGRKGWEGLIKSIVESNRSYLTKLGS
jgi:prophage maintenance system killer protein